MKTIGQFLALLALGGMVAAPLVAAGCVIWAIVHYTVKYW